MLLQTQVTEEFARLERSHAELLGKYDTLAQVKAALERENAALRAERTALLRRLFGRRSEKLDQLQQGLFEEASGELEQERRQCLEAATSSPLEPATVPEQQAKRGRAPLPTDLPRERKEYPLGEEERCCPNCRAVMERFGEEITEELEYVPASLRVIEHVRPKYACKSCQQGILVAPGPDRPIEKGRPGPNLLAHIATSKFGDHVPLYRLSQIFARQGAQVGRKTMCGWMGALAELLRPIVDAMKRQLLTEPLLQSDDTPVPYQDRSLRGKTARGFLWAYTKPWAEVVYEFTTNRSRAGPLNFLAGYQGYVQADAYSGYNELFRRGQIHHIGCMAHVRRKIYESRAEHPEAAELLLAGIQKLYRIERSAKDQGIVGEDLVALRRGEPTRVLTVLREYVDSLVPQTLPKSGFGRAVRYAIEQWPAIGRYAEIAQAELDNNSCEHTIRPVALGRKNWLFAGSEDGGHRAAVIYSLVTTCKRLGIDPYAYLADVTARVSTHKMSRIDELTPRAWKLARAS